MHFLGGERLFIKPSNSNLSTTDQLNDCIQQLKALNQDLELYKINVFIDSDSPEDYIQQHNAFHKAIVLEFPNPLLISVIAQPPLTCRIIIEAFYFDQRNWICSHQSTSHGSAKFFTRGGDEFLIGTLQANKGDKAFENSKDVFETLANNLKANQFPVKSIIRQWNYIQDIVAIEGKHQNYQDFNDIRSDFYLEHFENTGYPAATGIGMNQGGLIVEYIAMRSAEAVSHAVDNKQQISAHRYSEDVLKGGCPIKTTPKFERARFLNINKKSMFFISGTASIIGEKTIGIDDPAKQTEVSILNIKALYSDDILEELGQSKEMARYGHARIYVKNEAHFESIRTACRKAYGNLPMVFIKADICRDNLLVEIEGEVILK